MKRTIILTVVFVFGTILVASAIGFSVTSINYVKRGFSITEAMKETMIDIRYGIEYVFGKNSNNKENVEYIPCYNLNIEVKGLGV